MVYDLIPDGLVFHKKSLHVVRKRLVLEDFEYLQVCLQRVTDAPFLVQVTRREAVRAWGIHDDKLDDDEELAPIGTHSSENVKQRSPQLLLHFLMYSFDSSLFHGSPRGAEAMAHPHERNELSH